MHRSIATAAMLAAFFLSSNAALAQPAGAPSRSASTPHGMMGPHGRAGENYTHGWSMMSPQERAEHREQMRGAQTVDECRRISDTHRELMEQRAKKRGFTMRGPRREACAGYR